MQGIKIKQQIHRTIVDSIQYFSLKVLNVLVANKCYQLKGSCDKTLQTSIACEISNIVSGNVSNVELRIYSIEPIRFKLLTD